MTVAPLLRPEMVVVLVLEIVDRVMALHREHGIPNGGGLSKNVSLEPQLRVLTCG